PARAQRPVAVAARYGTRGPRSGYATVKAPCIPICAWPGMKHAYSNVPVALAVNENVVAPSPAEVGSPIGMLAAPAIAGWPTRKGTGLMGPVTNHPWAWSVSAFTNSTVTVAPWGTTSSGLVSPPIVKLMSGAPGATATTVNATSGVVNVMRLPARSTVAFAGCWAASCLTADAGTVIGACPCRLVPACLPMASASPDAAWGSLGAGPAPK